MGNEEIKKIVFKVFRFNPSVDVSPRWKEYQVEVDRGTTVLDALLKIKEEQDPSLAIRYSCRQAVCGSCGMMINGKQRLACFTRVLELKSNRVIVEPLSNLPITRDLVTDFSDLFVKEKSIKPYIIRNDVDEMMTPTGMYLQKPDELLKYLQFADCIECGLCSSACPTFSTDRLFLTPMILNRAYRFSADPRDNGLDSRLPIIDSEHGCWRCHFATACSNVCPKGVDPAKSIQLLKKMVTSSTIFKTFKKKPVELSSVPHAVVQL
ncbi:MAG: succinate dehydrogenase iron-sulfur subunit [Candidatus Caldarchaeales archaeon]